MSMQFQSNQESSALEKKEQALVEVNSTGTVVPFPTRALVELSNWCNHACVFCSNPRMERKKGFLDLAVFEKFVTQGVRHGLNEIGLYTTGEPFSSKNLEEYVGRARARGVAYIFLTTNGALATPDRARRVIDAGLSSIKFSVNAGTRETYKLVHGRDEFEKVLGHIRFISEYRRTHAPHLRMFASCIVTRFITEHEKSEFRRQVLPLVDDIAFYGVGGQAGQSLDQLAILEGAMTDGYPPPGAAKPCFMLWNRLHLTFEGYLTLCCVDYEDALTYADLNPPDADVAEAWNNQVMQDMRRRHQTQDLSGTLCQNCLYGTREKVRPLTTVGHADVTEHLSSHRARGVKSVANRLHELARRHEGAAEALPPALSSAHG